MPARPLIPLPRSRTAVPIALACLAPHALMASHITDAEMQKMLTIQPVSAAEIIQPGGIQARYTKDGTIFNISVLNGEDGIDFVAQFPNAKISLEDLNHWNANTHFQAYRVEGDKARVNTRLFLPDGGYIGDVVPTPGYITLTYKEFAAAVHRFGQFLMDRQAKASASQPSTPTQVTAAPPTTAAETKPAATPSETAVAARTSSGHHRANHGQSAMDLSRDQRSLLAPERTAAGTLCRQRQRRPVVRARLHHRGWALRLPRRLQTPRKELHQDHPRRRTTPGGALLSQIPPG